MKTRKVISAILAGACAISALGFSAFAEASDGKEVKAGGTTTFKVTAAPVAAAISVSVPSSVAAVINPYGVEVSDSKGNEYTAAGVSSALYTVRNFTTTSNVAINVEASLTVPTESTGDGKATKEAIKVVTDSEKVADITNPKKTTDKTVAAWVVASDAKSLDGDIKAIDVAGEKAITVDATDSEDAIFFTNVTALKGSDGKATEVTTKPGTGTLTVLPKATKAKSQEAGDDADAAATYGVAKFAIGGAVSDSSVGAWGSSDKISLNLVLDIGPTATAATTGD